MDRRKRGLGRARWARVEMEEGAFPGEEGGRALRSVGMTVERLAMAVNHRHT